MLLIYGAYGYTGELIARRAVELGLRPILSGRSEERLRPLARELGLDQRAARLDGPDARASLARALEGVRCVLHCAGPFVHTSAPMLDACLVARAHYLDITGEIPVFEALARRDRDAHAAGIAILPGVGFDVVPSDCLALHLKQRLPSATRLRLGILSRGGVSHGTALTALEHLEEGAMVRRQGRLEQIRLGSLYRTIEFLPGSTPRAALAVAWGDVASAWYSTGIPSIEVYWAMPDVLRRYPALAKALPLAQRLATTGPVRRLLRARIERSSPGPTSDERARGSAVFWGEVEDDAGRSATARLFTPEGYALTVESALLVARKVLGGEVAPGFHTPAAAYGADLVLELAGVRRED